MTTLAPDEPLDIGNPQHVQERDKRTRQRERQAETDLREVMSTGAGRRFVGAVLAVTHHDKPSYVPGDTHGTAFNEGARSVGVWLSDNLKRLGLSPEEPE